MLTNHGGVGATQALSRDGGACPGTGPEIKDERSRANNEWMDHRRGS